MLRNLKRLGLILLFLVFACMAGIGIGRAYRHYFRKPAAEPAAVAEPAGERGE